MNVETVRIFDSKREAWRYAVTLGKGKDSLVPVRFWLYGSGEVMAWRVVA